MSRNINLPKRMEDSVYQAAKDTENGKLIITTLHGVQCVLFIQGQRLTAVRMIPNVPSKLDAIYIGRIKDVAKNIHAYFVEIAKGEVCFLPEKEAENPFLTNRVFDGRLVQGDELVVCVTKDAIKTKQPTLTANLCRKRKYELYLQNAQHKTAFTVLKEPESPLLLAIRQLASPDEYQEIITDDADVYKLLHENAIHIADKTLRHYEDGNFPLSKLYSLETKMDTALNRRIWLKSGAYLIIEPTEALTVIDVNSGKYEVKKANKHFYYDINKEAAVEVVKQMRLRNLSGMILVDFINMQEKEDEDRLLGYMQELLKSDPVNTCAVDITALGIMEITRQKIYKPLHEQAAEVNF